jgi:hypothetical protein
MAGPCIADSDCIDLSVDGSGNLVAELIISGEDGNGAECLPDGLYAAVGEQSVGCVSAAESTTGPHASPTGDVIVRSGSFTIINPSSIHSAVGLRIENWGTVQFTSASAGAFVTCTIEGRILPNPYVGGPYVVWNNSSGSANTIAFPGWGINVLTCPTLLTPGETQTFEWRQTINVSAGSVTSITCRTNFFYIYVIALPT